MSTLKIAVLYDRVWEEDGADAGPQEKAPVTRTLDKKDVVEFPSRGGDIKFPTWNLLKQTYDEAWCLATSRVKDGAAAVVKLYSRRFTIEETFRDTKDIRFGMGLSSTHISDAGRRDRLLLLGAMAHALLTLLGEAGERCGLDRTLKTNTSAKRQMSLYNQGTFWFRALPNMIEEDIEKLMPAFDTVIREHKFFCEVYGVV